MTGARSCRSTDPDDSVAIVRRATWRRHTDHELVPAAMIRPYLVAEPELAFAVEDAGRAVSRLSTATTGACRSLDVPDTGEATCAGRSPAPGPERLGSP
jgi:hypothetical protein